MECGVQAGLEGMSLPNPLPLAQTVSFQLSRTLCSSWNSPEKEILFIFGSHISISHSPWDGFFFFCLNLNLEESKELSKNSAIIHVAEAPLSP